MICTEDEKFYPAGTTWNLYGCTVELLEVLHDGGYTIVCDITVDGQTHHEEMLQDGTTYPYGAYTVTCRGWIGASAGDQLAQTIICTESEANDVLSLYFRPWPWTNIDGVMGDVASKVVEIDGAIANALSEYTGYEYVSHEIVKERPKGRSRDYVVIRIYIHNTTEATPMIAPIPVALVIKLGIAIAIISFALGIIVMWKHESANYLLLEAEVARLSKELDAFQTAGENDDVLSGEISPDKYIELIYEDLREKKEESDLLNLNSSIYAEFEDCVDDAINMYKSSEKTQADLVVLTENRVACNDSYHVQKEAEIDDREPTPFIPDLLDDDTLLKYAKYGLLALFGIMAVKAAID